MCKLFSVAAEQSAKHQKSEASEIIRSSHQVGSDLLVWTKSGPSAVQDASSGFAFFLRDGMDRCQH